MDRAKVSLLLIFLFIIPSASALTFKVNVVGITNAESHFIRYKNTTESYQTINATVENSGSIGCTYRIMGKFRYDNETYTRYSHPYPLFPGASALADLKFLPMNYTGPINTSLYIDYCDQKKEVDSFVFNHTERVLSNNSIESETIRSNLTGALIETSIEEGLLIPQEAPPYWKASSTHLKNGKAYLRYEAPIFDRRKTLKYLVLNESTGELIGNTEVELEPEENFMRFLKENVFKISLIFSLLANVILFSLHFKNRDSER